MFQCQRVQVWPNGQEKWIYVSRYVIRIRGPPNQPPHLVPHTSTQAEAVVLRNPSDDHASEKVDATLLSLFIAGPTRDHRVDKITKEGALLLKHLIDGHRSDSSDQWHFPGYRLYLPDDRESASGVEVGFLGGPTPGAVRSTGEVARNHQWWDILSPFSRQVVKVTSSNGRYMLSTATAN